MACLINNDTPYTFIRVNLRLKIQIFFLTENNEGLLEIRYSPINCIIKEM